MKQPKTTPDNGHPNTLVDTLVDIVGLVVVYRYPDGPTISDIARATQSASRALHIDRLSASLRKIAPCCKSPASSTRSPADGENHEHGNYQNPR
jgi:hypothetical protein